MRRTVFFISDGTAITIETVGHSLLTQFPSIEFRQITIPFVGDEVKAHKAVEQINHCALQDGAPPIIFNSIVDESIRSILKSSAGVTLDLFGAFLHRMEKVLGVKRHASVGQAHGVVNLKRYEARMDATNYALSHDDGISTSYDKADLILIGVSRSGKTPTCLYIALHFGVKAANYPLTDTDLERQTLPAFLRSQKTRIAGLTIDADRLSQIRETRRPGSKYASLKQCHWEVEAAESLMRMSGIPVFNTTHSSIEEIGSRVLAELGLKREIF